MIDREQLVECIETRKIPLAVLLSILLMILLVLLFYTLNSDARLRERNRQDEETRLAQVIPPERMWLPSETLDAPRLELYRGPVEVWTEEDAMKLYRIPDSADLEAIEAAASRECMSILESVP